MRVGVVFPGQGSQLVGMGMDVLAAYPASARVLERANEVLGYDLIALLRDGPDERLRETRYSQPAIFAVNVALYEALAGEFEPVVSAGHSFGEFCSLTIAGAIDFDDALRLVQQRALAMNDAAQAAPGAMDALLGLDVDAVRSVVEKATQRGRVQLANFNSPQQIVISGDVAAVEYAAALALDAGAKRVVPLNVSGAWHSELMEPARVRFAPFVETAPLRLPRFDVVSNVDAQPYRDVATIRKNLIASVTGEVRWHETALRMLEDGPELVAEFGASAVLTPIMRRVSAAPLVVHAGDAGGIERLREALTAGATV
jgi:[acyl-carrier-protein] S-malonyltransferase